MLRSASACGYCCEASLSATWPLAPCLWPVPCPVGGSDSNRTFNLSFSRHSFCIIIDRSCVSVSRVEPCSERAARLRRGPTQHPPAASSSLLRIGEFHCHLELSGTHARFGVQACDTLAHVVSCLAQLLDCRLLSPSLLLQRVARLQQLKCTRAECMGVRHRHVSRQLLVLWSDWLRRRQGPELAETPNRTRIAVPSSASASLILPSESCLFRSTAAPPACPAFSQATARCGSTAATLMARSNGC